MTDIYKKYTKIFEKTDFDEQNLLNYSDRLKNNLPENISMDKTVFYNYILYQIKNNKEKLKTDNISFIINKIKNKKIFKIKDILPYEYLNDKAIQFVYQIDNDGSSYVFKIYTANPNDSYFTIIIMEEQNYLYNLFKNRNFNVIELFNNNDLYPENYEYSDRIFYFYIKYKIDNNNLSTFKIDNSSKLELDSEILPEPENYFEIIYYLDGYDNEDSEEDIKQEYLFLYQNEYIINIISLNELLTVSIMTKKEYLNIDFKNIMKIINKKERSLTQTKNIITIQFDSSSKLTTLDEIKKQFLQIEKPKYQIKNFNKNELIISKTEKKDNKKYEYKYKFENIPNQDYNKIYKITLQLFITDYDNKDFKNLLKKINEVITTMKDSNKHEIEDNYESNSSIIEDIIDYYNENNGTIQNYESNELIIINNKQKCRIIIKENTVNKKFNYNIKIFNLETLAHELKEKNKKPLNELKQLPFKIKRLPYLKPLPPLQVKNGGSNSNKRLFKKY